MKFNQRKVWRGVGYVMLGHLGLLIGSLFYQPLLVGFFVISLTQLVYVLPLAAAYRKQDEIVQGIWLGAGVTFLLNASCFGLVLSGNMSWFFQFFSESNF